MFISKLFIPITDFLQKKLNRTNLCLELNDQTPSAGGHSWPLGFKMKKIEQL